MRYAFRAPLKRAGVLKVLYVDHGGMKQAGAPPLLAVLYETEKDARTAPRPRKRRPELAHPSPHRKHVFPIDHTM